MKNLKTAFHDIKIMVVIVLCLFITSCNGRAYTEKQRDVIHKIKSQDSNLENDPSNYQNSFQFSNFGNPISNVVRTVFQDSKGNIWFGTQNGAFQYNGNSLIHIDGIKCELGRGVTVTDIAADKEGRIWFGHSGGISVFDGETISNYHKGDGLISNNVWCISVDNNNHVWIGTTQGVSKFDGSLFTAFEIPEGKIDTTRGVSSKKMIHDIMQDSQGRMWFSTNGGVYIKENDSLINISEKDGLKTNFVNQVIEDKNGSFWISTSKGLFNYSNKILINVTEGITDSFKGEGSIMQDSNGDIWFNSNLREIYSFHDKGFSKYQITEDDYGPAPFEIYEDQQQRVWLVGFGGAFRLENGKFINITQNGPF